jgi:pyruvate dehydrogenase (quinone)
VTAAGAAPHSAATTSRRSSSRRCSLTGRHGIYIDNPEQVGSAWERALAAGRPAVVEFKTDPEVPPLPPHITLKQAHAFASAPVKGDPDEHGLIVGTAGQVLASILPGRGK